MRTSLSPWYQRFTCCFTFNQLHRIWKRNPVINRLWKLPARCCGNRKMKSTESHDNGCGGSGWGWCGYGRFLNTLCCWRGFSRCIYYTLKSSPILKAIVRIYLETGNNEILLIYGLIFWDNFDKASNWEGNIEYVWKNSAMEEMRWNHNT